MKLFTTWTNGAFCAGSLPDPLREAWGAARAIALSKPVGGFRRSRFTLYKEGEESSSTSVRSDP
jgi:hypothetical protein